MCTRSLNHQVTFDKNAIFGGTKRIRPKLVWKLLNPHLLYSDMLIILLLHVLYVSGSKTAMDVLYIQLIMHKAFYLGSRTYVLIGMK